MTISTKYFLRRTFGVDAVRVTQENIYEVAAWCYGEVKKVIDFGYHVHDHGKLLILIDDATDPLIARVGDWVVSRQCRFRVFSNKAFRNSFIDPSGDLHDKILSLVKSAMSTESYTPEAIEQTAKQTTYKITALINQKKD